MYKWWYLIETVLRTQSTKHKIERETLTLSNILGPKYVGI